MNRGRQLRWTLGKQQQMRQALPATASADVSSLKCNSSITVEIYTKHLHAGYLIIFQP
jgi:hypothetical protein